MWKELGIIGGTAIIVLAALYFVIKWAVKSGMKEAYEEIPSVCEESIGDYGFCRNVRYR